MKLSHTRSLLLLAVMCLNGSVSEAGIWDAIKDAVPSSVKSGLETLQDKTEGAAGAISGLVTKSPSSADGYTVKYLIPKMDFVRCGCPKGNDEAQRPFGTLLGGSFTLQISYPPPVDGRPQPPTGKVLSAELSTTANDLILVKPLNSWDPPLVLKGATYTKGKVFFNPNQLGNARPFPATATVSFEDAQTNQWVTITVPNFDPSARRAAIYFARETAIASTSSGRETAPNTEYLVATPATSTDAASMDVEPKNTAPK